MNNMLSTLWRHNSQLSQCSRCWGKLTKVTCTEPFHPGSQPEAAVEMTSWCVSLIRSLSCGFQMTLASTIWMMNSGTSMYWQGLWSCSFESWRIRCFLLTCLTNLPRPYVSWFYHSSCWPYVSWYYNNSCFCPFVERNAGMFYFATVL